MHGADLPPDRAPLAEVVFELKWKLTPSPLLGGPPTDLAYKLLPGSLFERLKPVYPFHEALPAASVPDEFVPQLVQHRFRTAQDAYPLVQVGPGILAVNDSRGYTWRRFLPQVVEAVTKLQETYTGQLEPETVVLRYVNAVPFDMSSGNALDFMRDNLKVAVQYPSALFSDGHVLSSPGTILLHSTHKADNPAGLVSLKFRTGEFRSSQHLLWETEVRSSGGDAPGLTQLQEWLDTAHRLARAWFFVLIEGRLEDEYRS